MTSWFPLMKMGGQMSQMTNEEAVQFKLSLAKAWLDNGQEQLARDIIRSIVETEEGENE